MLGFTVRGNVGIFLREFVIKQKTQNPWHKILRKERVKQGYYYVDYRVSLPQEMFLAPVCETNNDALR